MSLRYEHSSFSAAFVCFCRRGADKLSLHLIKPLSGALRALCSMVSIYLSAFQIITTSLMFLFFFFFHFI